ncbi:MAG: hypothetical protein R3178_04120 [Rhodothermales bacterium]|nr:hypothetical protein [Rhodothermales bacterium]
MSTSRKQALAGLTFWIVAAVTFLIVFFRGGGPESFASQSGRVLLTSIAYGIGFLVHFGLVVRFRNRRSGDVTLRDDRDDEVSRLANGVSLVVTLMFVYATGIVLWEIYRHDGFAPIGWFWFVAYVSVMVGFIAHAAATLIIDSSGITEG